MMQKLLFVGLLSWCMQIQARDTITPSVPTCDLCDQLYIHMKSDTTANPDICYPVVGEAKPFNQTIRL